jgi:hypothetical protein
VAQSNEAVIDLPAAPTAIQLFLPLINR